MTSEISTNAIIEKIREISHGLGDQDDWIHICEIIEDYKGSDLNVVLKYATQSIEHWPDKTCKFTCTNSSQFNLLPSFLALVRTLEISSSFFINGEIKSLRLKTMNNIKRIRILVPNLSCTDLGFILNAINLTSLTHLTMKNMSIDLEAIREA